MFEQVATNNTGSTVFDNLPIVHAPEPPPLPDAVEDTSDRIRPLTQIAIIPTNLLETPEFLGWDTKLPRHAKSTTGDSRVAVYLTMAKPLRYMLWKLRHLAPDSTPGGLIRKVIEAEYLRNFPDEQPQ